MPINNQCPPPTEQLDQLRRLIRTVDPAALTKADRLALLDLVAAATKTAETTD